VCQHVEAAPLIEAIGALSGRSVGPIRGGPFIPRSLISFCLTLFDSGLMPEPVSPSSGHQKRQKGGRSQPQ